ncbi:MAG: flagellar biosynthetic protein FliO [Gammaproteobacteria bacterium]|nr:flagellar biosynthetic protein FliO [Gammaproteobacteria bacterium]
MIDPVLAAEVTTQKLPRATPEISIGGQLFRTIIGLSFVIAVIIGIGWLAKRYGTLKMGSDNALIIRSGISVGQKERVVLIEIGDEQILVGVAPGNVTKLHVLKNKVAINRDVSTMPDGGQFLDRLKKVMKEKGGQ